jgi:heat shock protein HslJ
MKGKKIMKNIRSKVLILITIIIGLSAFAFAQRPDKLSTEQWQLSEIYGRRVADSKAMLELNMNRTRFTGNTGCNRMFGNVSVRGRQIDFGSIGTTKMACDPRSNRLETDVLRGLNSVTRYRQIGDTLELFRRNQLMMKFTAIVKEYPDGDNSTRLRLEDRKWMLEQIGTRVNIKALPEAFVVFDGKKHSAGGNSSCNVFGGSYTATRERLRITNVISTMRACIEDERMQVEREFLDGLRNANRFEIRDNRLKLYKGNEILLTLRGERKQ